LSTAMLWTIINPSVPFIQNQRPDPGLPAYTGTMLLKTINIQLLLVVLLLGGSESGLAQQGTFTALKDCEATKALRQDNPGNIRISVGETYRFFNTNKEPPTHYLIDIPDAPATNRRWVDIDCGDLNVDSNIAKDANGDKKTESSRKTQSYRKTKNQTQTIEPDSIENVLAASWQPTFCATNRGASKKECQSQTANRPDATQFSIHGLWPDDLNDKDIFPCYCGDGKPVSCRTKQKAAKIITLSDNLWNQLEIVMPGVQSGLHLHEWSKHGTCYEDFISGDDNGADAEEYYAETVSLINDLNASEVRELFVANLGKELTLKEVKSSFDKSFGKRAGDRVFMNCSRIKGKDYISELWISLAGAISVDSDFKTLIQNAPTTDSSSNRRPCYSGIVSRVKG